MHSYNKPPVFVGFDLETTGFDPDKNKIIEVGMLRFTYDQFGKLVKLGGYSQLIDPQEEIPTEVQAITNIRQEDVEGQPLLDDVLADIEKMFAGADYIMGHNVAFDMSFLGKMIKFNAPEVDSQFFAEAFLLGLPSYSLDVIPFELGIERGAAHRAYDDTVVSAEVMLAALRQYRNLGSKQIKIHDVWRKAGLHEAPILKAFSELTSHDNAIYKPKLAGVANRAYDETIKTAVTAKLKEPGQKIIIHTATHVASESVIAGASEYKNDGKLMIAVKNKSLLGLGSAYQQVKSAESSICSSRLEEITTRKSIQKPEAVLAAKLLVSHELDPDYAIWPKITTEERAYLPQFMQNQTDCTQHGCTNFDENITNPFYVTHFDLWDIPEQTAKKVDNILLVDFDEAADTLKQKLEVKLFIDLLPRQLEPLRHLDTGSAKVKLSGLLPLPGFSETNPKTRASEIVSEIIAKNDLFWGLLGIAYAKSFDHSTQLHLTEDRQDELVYQKMKQPVEKVIEGLKKLSTLLSQSKDTYAPAYKAQIQSIEEHWRKLLSPTGDYHVCLENYAEQLTLRLIPSSSYVAKSFKSVLTKNTTLTIGSGASTVTAHYINWLDLSKWPALQVTSPQNNKSSLLVVNNPGNQIEGALQTILAHPNKKVVLVGKNTAEVKLYAEHFKIALGESVKVFALDRGGSGANKVIYGFAQADAGVLIIPPRGKIWHIPWPTIGLAIISSIPFPPPDPTTGFVDGTLPRAMLQQKAIVVKLLENTGPDMQLYLMDSRLLNKNYGRSFIDLASELCGCDPEYISLSGTHR